MSIPKDLMYTRSHEWLKLEGQSALFGITNYAQEKMGDIVFVNLPQEGDAAVAGESIADMESVKAVSDIYSPASGTVAAVNEEVLDTPNLINSEPYETWLVKLDSITENEELLTPEQYEQLLKEEE